MIRPTLASRAAVAKLRASARSASRYASPFTIIE
jgi:hypothetical protein